MDPYRSLTLESINELHSQALIIVTHLYYLKASAQLENLVDFFFVSAQVFACCLFYGWNLIQYGIMDKIKQ